MAEELVNDELEENDEEDCRTECWKELFEYIKWYQWTE